MASVTNSVVTLFTQQLLFYSCARSVGVLTQGPCWSHSHTACCTHGGGVYVEFSHNQPTNQPTLCRFHRAPPHPPPAASPSPMDSDVASASDVEVSDADPSDVASDESMEPPEEDVPEELVAVAWLGRSSPIGSRYFQRDYIYIYVYICIYIYIYNPLLGEEKTTSKPTISGGSHGDGGREPLDMLNGREEHSKYIATFFCSDSPS